MVNWFLCSHGENKNKFLIRIKLLIQWFYPFSFEKKAFCSTFMTRIHIHKILQWFISLSPENFECELFIHPWYSFVRSETPIYDFNFRRNLPVIELCLLFFVHTREIGSHAKNHFVWLRGYIKNQPPHSTS